jgi:hemerythrin-like metal-binding protein
MDCRLLVLNGRGEEAMDILKWRTSYETGIPSMDAQHQRLISLVNQMYGIIRDHEGHAALDAILGEMSNYAEKHLKDEEALLRQHNYPGLNEQEVDHGKYFEQIKTLYSELGKDREEAAKKIYAFLRSWWISHIVGLDKKYGPFLQEKGVQ